MTDSPVLTTQAGHHHRFKLADAARDEPGQLLLVVQCADSRCRMRERWAVPAEAVVDLRDFWLQVCVSCTREPLDRAAQSM